MTGAPVLQVAVSRLRARLVALHLEVSPVVQSSMIRSICNAWTTSGRFSGPRSPCSFGCGARRGDRWAHFTVCSAVRRMWLQACPSTDSIFFAKLTPELVLLLSLRLAPGVVVQLALWSDVVGHCANDIRAAGAAPALVLADGHERMAARLRFLAVQCDSLRTCLLYPADPADDHPCVYPVGVRTSNKKNTQSLRFVHTHTLTKIHSTCPLVKSLL